mmetsp:Transcript_26348/g.74088  ORF Transcript_26348/g.74088 Transcript_26348/m.74088 type:complete len:96 (-) Transcript_26348:35-322(-)
MEGGIEFGVPVKVSCPSGRAIEAQVLGGFEIGKGAGIVVGGHHRLEGASVWAGAEALPGRCEMRERVKRRECNKIGGRSGLPNEMEFHMSLYEHT